jgi:Na+/phosphate symporter
MAQDSTRRLLKVFGIAVTNLEDALEAALAEDAKKAEAELRERMKEVIALVERLSERAAKL